MKWDTHTTCISVGRQWQIVIRVAEKSTPGHLGQGMQVGKEMSALICLEVSISINLLCQQIYRNYCFTCCIRNDEIK